jgi:myosin heavy subunit
MTPDPNLDEDILQCREEILQALNQNAEKVNLGADRDNTNSSESDKTDTEESLLPQGEEELAGTKAPLLEDLSNNEEDTLPSESTGLGDPLDPSEQPFQDSSSFPSPEKSSVPPEDSASAPQRNTSASPVNLDTLQKNLHLLTIQKENLSQTCQEQEKHIAVLTQELEQLRRTLEESEKTRTALASENERLKLLQDQADQLNIRIEQIEAERKELNRQLSILNEEVIRLQKEKTQQQDETAEARRLQQSLETRQAVLEEEIRSLQKTVEALRNTVALLNQENEQLRQQNSSLEQQVRRLEEEMAGQETEFLKTASALREELRDKNEQIETWKLEYNHLYEQITSEENGDEASWSAEASETPSDDFSGKEKEPRAAEKGAEDLDAKTDPDFFIPRFDLSAQMLAAQRKESSARRQPPTSGRISPGESVRKVVHQFVGAAQTEPSPAQESPEKSDWPKTEDPSNQSRDAAEMDAILSEIIRRDIEQFCRNHPGVYIEFPSR